MVTRVGVPARMYIGHRTVLAMTCRRCGQLRQGSEFGKRKCRDRRGGLTAYLDRRCNTTCRWRHMEANVVGRNGLRAA